MSEEKNTKKRWETGDKVFHYKIMQYLASEPMGEIYLAKDTQLDRMVAVIIAAGKKIGRASCRERV